MIAVVLAIIQSEVYLEPEANDSCVGNTHSILRSFDTYLLGFTMHLVGQADIVLAKRVPPR